MAASVGQAAATGGGGEGVLLMRGPRVKCGVEWGSGVLTEVSPTTGRMCYRGRWAGGCGCAGLHGICIEVVLADSASASEANRQDATGRTCLQRAGA